MSPVGLLQPLPIPDKISENVSMDFTGGLPNARKSDIMLVVVDRLTKYCHFMALSHPYIAKEMANIFAKEVIKLHGCPRTIILD